MAFTYPRRPPGRRHGPRGYRAYQSYKPWLRDEFRFRCVYCLWRERWGADGDQMFSVDHLWPRMTHPERLYDYDRHCQVMTPPQSGGLDDGEQPQGLPGLQFERWLSIRRLHPRPQSQAAPDCGCNGEAALLRTPQLIPHTPWPRRLLH